MYQRCGLHHLPLSPSIRTHGSANAIADASANASPYASPNTIAVRITDFCADGITHGASHRKPDPTHRRANGGAYRIPDGCADREPNPRSDRESNASSYNRAFGIPDPRSDRVPNPRSLGKKPHAVENNGMAGVTKGTDLE